MNNPSSRSMWSNAIDTIRGTSFTMRLPHDVKQKALSIMHRYAKDMVVHPTIDEGKVVVEEMVAPNASGATHVIRILATALFTNKDKMMRIAMGESTEENYFESWMSTMTGRNNVDGFDVMSLELYVRREGGWELIVSETARGTAPETDKGEAWPEPPREPEEPPRESLKPWA